MKKQWKEFYESLTYSKYDFRRRKHVRKVLSQRLMSLWVSEEIKNVFTFGLLLFSIIVAIAHHHFIPKESNQFQQSIQKVERIYTDYQELLLEFDDEKGKVTFCLD